jgi:hypothetical protein
MDTMTLLDCGHEPTTTGAGIGTGVVHGPDGTMCYDCACIEILASAAGTEPGKALPTLYISRDPDRTDDRYGFVTTWDGKRVGRVVSWGGRHPWSDERRYVSVVLTNGVIAHGTGAFGMYASLRRSAS